LLRLLPPPVGARRGRAAAGGRAAWAALPGLRGPWARAPRPPPVAARVRLRAHRRDPSRARQRAAGSLDGGCGDGRRRPSPGSVTSARAIGLLLLVVALMIVVVAAAGSAIAAKLP